MVCEFTAVAEAWYFLWFSTVGIVTLPPYQPETKTNIHPSTHCLTA